MRPRARAVVLRGHVHTRLRSHAAAALTNTPVPAPPRPPPAAAARAAGAVLGCVVGDAAAMGVQWIYSLEKLEELLVARLGRSNASGGLLRAQDAEGSFQVGAGLEFFEPPQSPFLPGYTTGRHSPYGEGTMVLLRSLAAEGGLDCRAYAGLYAATLGEGFDGYRNASTTVSGELQKIQIRFLSSLSAANALGVR